MNSKKLPMRNGVGVIILNNENKVFVGKRKDNPVNKWQMPQGGVEKGESYLSAMKRELYEETSIKSINILREIDGFFEYELPKNLVGIIWKGKFRGQKQKWFIAKFIGNENEINLQTKNPEFIEWKWIIPDELPKTIVDFKKKMYVDLANKYSISLIEGSLIEMVSSNLMQSDGIHPNQAGHVLIEQEVLKEIVPILFSVTD